MFKKLKEKIQDTATEKLNALSSSLSPTSASAANDVEKTFLDDFS